jgi:long-chain acyl-CoA synthetase
MIAENLIGFENIPQTIPHFCLESFRRNKKPDALSYKLENVWKHISGAEVIEKIKRIALGLSDLGVKAGDRIAIISENRPEWSLTDLAVLALRAVVVPIYTTQAVEQVRYILEDSGAKMLFVSGKKIFKHAEKAIESVETIEKLIFFDDEGVPENDNRALTLADIERRGEELDKIDSKSFENFLSKLDTNDLATVIYTSGTTGEPKGVMLTHENFVSNITAISKGLPIKTTDRSLAVLPLSHIFERTVFYVLCSNSVAINYCASFDQLASHLQETRPTIMTAVPRLFEQVYHKIVKKGKAAGGWKTKLFDWALQVGQEYWEAKDTHNSVSPVLAAKHAIASRLVF